MRPSTKFSESQANLSRDNGVPESTIHGWLRDEEKSCDFEDVVDSTVWMERKTARNAKDPQLDKVVITWCVKERQTGTPNSSPVLRIQAQKLHNDLHVDNPSNSVVFKGWLYRIQRRHGITQVKKINGETRSSDTNVADEFVPIKKNT